MMLLAVLLQLCGCGLAQGIARDFGGYGGLVANKVDPSLTAPEPSTPDIKTTSASSEVAAPAVVRADSLKVPSFKTPPKEKDVAVVIGIQKYRSIPVSDYSAKDAALVKEYLLALGFREKNILLLVDERAALTDIRKSLETWLPNRVTKESKVFIYFSGHGSPDPAKGTAYLVPYDGDPNYLKDTCYPLNNLYDQLGKLPAKEVTVILDSCFSGAGGRSVLAKGARPLVMMSDKNVAPPTKKNLVVMSATQGSQISASSPDKEHGIFTYYFLKAINDGNTDLKSIFNYLKSEVEDEARRLNVEQSPSVSPEVDKMPHRQLL